MKIKFLIPLAISVLVSCGQQEADDKGTQSRDPLENIKEQLLRLQAEISGIVKSDYATCGGALSTAAQRICQIAQAATVEARVEMRGALQDLASQLESRIDAAGSDISALASSWKTIYGVDFPLVSGAPTPSEADCLAMNSNASLLECIKVTQSAIDALQASVAVLSNTVTGAMSVVEVGSENIDAGPVYEQLVRLGDKTRINAYTDGLGPALGVSSNPIDPTNGSPNVVITTSAAHGLAVGNRVDLEDCGAGAGFTWQDLRGRFTISAVTATTFTINLGKNATNSSNFGGSLCIVRKFSGSGFSSIWVSANPSDSAVRQTTGGNKTYNFIIKKGLTGAGNANEGYVCYDTTNRSAAFATINAATAVGTTGNIICK